MADPKHLEILKTGVRKWNQWREEEPFTVPDLVTVTLVGRFNLIGANLKGANLAGSMLSVEPSSVEATSMVPFSVPPT